LFSRDTFPAKGQGRFLVAAARKECYTEKGLGKSKNAEMLRQKLPGTGAVLCLLRKKEDGL
jgi:hypothetical protein